MPPVHSSIISISPRRALPPTATHVAIGDICAVITPTRAATGNWGCGVESAAGVTATALPTAVSLPAPRGQTRAAARASSALGRRRDASKSGLYLPAGARHGREELSASVDGEGRRAPRGRYERVHGRSPWRHRGDRIARGVGQDSERSGGESCHARRALRVVFTRGHA